MKFRFLIGLILVSLATSIIPSNAVDTPNRSQTILNPSTFAFVFTEGSQGSGPISSLLTSTYSGPQPNGPDSHLCKSFSDSNCKVSGFNDLNAISVMDPCLPGTPQPCIKELSVIDSKGVIRKATFIRKVEAPIFPADPDVNLFSGGSTSLWRVKDYEGINDYAITYFIQSSNASDRLINPLGKFTPKTFSVYLYPFRERLVPSATSPKYQESVYPDGRLGIIGSGQITDMNCIWTENGKCGIEQEFDAGVSAELTINVPESLTGWLNGRLIDPEISVTPIGNAINELKIKAKPADVPSAYAEIPYSQTTDEMKQLYKYNSHAMSGSSVRDSVMTSGEVGFKYMSAFQKLLGDKAQIKSTSWKFGSLDGINKLYQNKCLQSESKILGLVTTNAMLYENTLPKFENGFLNYKVGGLHFNPDGTPFKGTYDLIMRSETARCLYGFSNAPVSAEISVVSADGEKQVATTRLSESKDWIHLSAYNFGFSSPTIQMKLEQKMEVIATPSPSVNPILSQTDKPTIASTKKTTITCLRGKAVAKVTAVNPKCPTGYKKK